MKLLITIDIISPYILLFNLIFAFYLILRPDILNFFLSIKQFFAYYSQEYSHIYDYLLFELFYYEFEKFIIEIKEKV